MYLYLCMYGLCRVYDGGVAREQTARVLHLQVIISLFATKLRGASIFRSKRLTFSKQMAGKNKSVGPLRFFFSRYQSVWVWVCFFFVRQNCFPQTKIDWTPSPGHHAFCSKATRQLIGLQLSEVPAGSRTDFTFESNDGNWTYPIRPTSESHRLVRRVS